MKFSNSFTSSQIHYWNDERIMPEELIVLSKVPGLPSVLRNELLHAYREVTQEGAVTYSTKARVEHYYPKYHSIILELKKELAKIESETLKKIISEQEYNNELYLELLDVKKQVLKLRKTIEHITKQQSKLRETIKDLELEQNKPWWKKLL